MSDDIFRALSHGEMPDEESDHTIIKQAPKLIKLTLATQMLSEISKVGPQLEHLVPDAVLMCDFRRAYHELVNCVVSGIIEITGDEEKILDILSSQISFECFCGGGHTANEIGTYGD